MTNIVRLAGSSKVHAEIAAELAKLDWIAVRKPLTTDQLALDADSISLVVGALSTVNALITAVATVWAARIVNRVHSSNASAQVRPALELRTDDEEILIQLGRNGEILTTSAILPSRIDEVTDILLLDLTEA